MDNVVKGNEGRSEWSMGKKGKENALSHTRNKHTHLRETNFQFFAKTCIKLSKPPRSRVHASHICTYFGTSMGGQAHLLASKQKCRHCFLFLFFFCVFYSH